MMGYRFLSNYLKNSDRVGEVINYLEKNNIQFQIEETVMGEDGELKPDLIGIYVILPENFDSIIDIFDSRENVGGLYIHYRYIELYEAEFKIKINNFLKILSDTHSVKSFNYTKSKGILMLIAEVNDKVGCIPASVILKLSKSFDTINYTLNNDRIIEISNIFGCDTDELYNILADNILDSYGIDIYALD